MLFLKKKFLPSISLQKSGGSKKRNDKDNRQASIRVFLHKTCSRKNLATKDTISKFEKEGLREVFGGLLARRQRGTGEGRKFRCVELPF